MSDAVQVAFNFDHTQDLIMLLRTLSSVILLASAVGVSAQTMKPGLWEMTSSLQNGGKDLTAAMERMQKQMASMPPEQRKMMQDMMAKQGVQMSASGVGGMSIKMCLTQEMVDRHEIAPKQHGNCTQTTSPRVGGTMKYSFKCTEPVSSGEGEVTFSSPEAYSMKMKVVSAERNMDMQSSGKWLGANCGDIKPIQVPTAK